MKKFLYSFFGTIAGIWVSVFLGVILLFMTIGAIAVSSGSNSTPISIKDDSVLHLDLSGTVVDRQSPVSLMDQIYGNGASTVSLNDIVDAIAAAKDDKRIKGIFIDCKGLSIGVTQAQAVMKALEDFKTSQKFVYSYADTYTQGEYYLASVADSVFINPIGMIDIHGLSATTVYFKDFLDKIGVEAQVVKVGTYKSAVEPFILSTMSEANREQQNLFLSNIWSYMKETLAENRPIAANAIDSLANNFLFAKNTAFYQSNGLVDGVKYRHQMEKMLADETGKSDDPDLVNFSDYAKANISPLKKKFGNGTNIAVLYALGDITESDPQGIASDRLVPEILKLADDKSIDGLILRVNSGGGSAFASEQIWEALEQFKSISGKPFYVSMGDVAASGGYYISCGAKRIYAEPSTLTGSIGIFGIIPNIEPLLRDKLGVNSGTVKTNNGAMPTIIEPMTEQQRAAMQTYVDNGYELFVSRCAKGRNKTVEQIKAVAEGRVWDGRTALKHGLVDKMGGLHDAIADMAAELKAESYYVTEYPAITIKWWEALLDMNENIEISTIGTDLKMASQTFRALDRIKNISPLQCRMDYIRLN